MFDIAVAEIKFNWLATIILITKVLQLNDSYSAFHSQVYQCSHFINSIVSSNDLHPFL